MLQSVKLQGTIRYDQDKIGQCDTIKTTGHLHTKTVELEKVERNRTALDIKSRFVFIYEEALVYIMDS